ncbi:serine/threonine-protein kinase [Arenimonas sp.]|uniref:serine/threonine-protein kinase n=1 Tax=Arenimonas sp. TaxID=1872635 RepID=UPI0025D635CE|nr:serine/threonine-protein kinase [Arenimonas sp.]
MTGTNRSGFAATATGQFAGAELTPGTVLAGRFEIRRLLGIGGMGVVYLAQDLDLGVPLALKLLRPELASRTEAFERFRQELLLARQVSSPHVVRIHDIARHEDRWFISMDLVDGESLERLLDREGALPVEQALAIARQLAAGLAAAHAKGIVHRDLKPSNILLDGQGHALISDFGVARSLGTSGVTHTGAIVGTPDYLSPEQARAAPVDARSDLYSLGLILYEMLSGKPAFSGGTAAESLTQRLLRPPPRLDKVRDEVPSWVARLVERLLQPAPARRFRDAESLIAAIDARHVPREFRARPALLAAATVAAATALFLLWPEIQGPTIPRSPADLAPPDRLVVLASPGRATDDTLAGAAELLRLGLSEGGDQPVVEAERTRIALAQTVMGSRSPTDRQLLEILPATRVLRLERRDGGALVATMSANSAGGTRTVEVAPGEPIAKAMATVAAEFSLGPLPPDLWPDTDEPLSNFGRALELRMEGRMEASTLAFRQLTGSHPGFGAGWLGLAETALLAGEQDLAAEAAQRGESASRLFPTRMVQVRERAEGRTEAALAVWQARVQSRPDDLDALLLLAALRVESGAFEDAEQSLQALLTRDPQDPRAWFLMGKTAILRGDPRAAVDEHLVRALVLYKRGRSRFGEAESTNALGVGYARLGQPEDAAEQYGKALALRRELGDRRGVASSQRNLAQLAMVRGDLDDARDRLAEAAGLFGALGDRAGAAAVDNELGLLAEERGNYAEALAAYTRALRAREAARDPPGIAESLNNIGFAHYQLGEYDSASVFWRQASDAFRSIDDRNGVVRAGQNLGLLGIARGDWEEARRLLDASLQEAEARHMLEEAAVSHRNLAELGIVQGRLADAAGHLAEARRLFEEREDVRGLMDADLLQVRLLAGAGRDVEALALLQGIGPALPESSLEQQAIAALLGARLHLDAGNRVDAGASLARARELALEAGLRVRRLEADVLAHAGGVGEATLQAEIDRLGNLPLQLAWFEQLARDRLARDDAAGAAEAYRRADGLLARRGGYVRATQLHSIGELALAAVGDPGAPAAAKAASEAAAALAAEANGGWLRRLRIEGENDGPPH